MAVINSPAAAGFGALFLVYFSCVLTTTRLYASRLTDCPRRSMIVNDKAQTLRTHEGIQSKIFATFLGMFNLILQVKPLGGIPT
jgi:hypothetical protein